MPVSLYESIIEVIDNEPQVVFVAADYEIETGEAERIAVDHAAKPSGAGDGGAQSSCEGFPASHGGLEHAQLIPHAHCAQQ